MPHPAATGGSPAPRIALKIDVGTLRGTRLGVPRLTELLTRYGAGATFFFNLGPDRTGRAIRRIAQRSLFRGGGRRAVVKHHGFKALLYGTLLPGPDIGKHCAATMRSVRDAGFEAGIHAWDRVRWEDEICTADAEWTQREMQRAIDRFESVFGTFPRLHAAPGWQTNIHSFRLSQRLGFDFCADTRGTCPYIPILNAEIVACPQIPTTLPTFDELIGRDEICIDNVGAHLARLASTTPASAGHVFTLQAELEGLALLPALETLVRTWTEAGVQLLSLGDYLQAAGAGSLPRHVTTLAPVAGRTELVTMQGPEFLAARASTIVPT